MKPELTQAILPKFLYSLERYIIKTQSDDCFEPIFDDASQGKFGQVWRYLSWGLNPGMCDRYSRTIMWHACNDNMSDPSSDLDIVNLLLGIGGYVGIPDVDGVDEIMIAVERDYDSYEIVKLLLEAGGTPNSINWGNMLPHYTALDSVICRSQCRMIKLLLDHGAKRGYELDNDLRKEYVDSDGYINRLYCYCEGR